MKRIVPFTASVFTMICVQASECSFFHGFVLQNEERLRQEQLQKCEEVERSIHNKPTPVVPLLALKNQIEQMELGTNFQQAAATTSSHHLRQTKQRIVTLKNYMAELLKYGRESYLQGGLCIAWYNYPKEAWPCILNLVGEDALRKLFVTVSPSCVSLEHVQDVFKKQIASLCDANAAFLLFRVQLSFCSKDLEAYLNRWFSSLGYQGSEIYVPLNQMIMIDRACINIMQSLIDQYGVTTAGFDAQLLRQVRERYPELALCSPQFMVSATTDELSSFPSVLTPHQSQQLPQNFLSRYSGQSSNPIQGENFHSFLHQFQTVKQQESSVQFVNLAEIPEPLRFFLNQYVTDRSEDFGLYVPLQRLSKESHEAAELALSRLGANSPVIQLCMLPPQEQKLFCGGNVVLGAVVALDLSEIQRNASGFGENNKSYGELFYSLMNRFSKEDQEQLWKDMGSGQEVLLYIPLNQFPEEVQSVCLASQNEHQTMVEGEFEGGVASLINFDFSERNQGERLRIALGLFQFLKSREFGETEESLPAYRSIFWYLGSKDLSGMLAVDCSGISQDSVSAVFDEVRKLTSGKAPIEIEKDQFLELDLSRGSSEKRVEVLLGIIQWLQDNYEEGSEEIRERLCGSIGEEIPSKIKLPTNGISLEVQGKLVGEVDRLLQELI